MKKLTKILLISIIIMMLCACSKKNEEPKTELELVTTLDQAILSLSTGKCDAVALDGTTAQNYVAQSDGQFAMSGVNFDLTIYGDYEGNVAAAKKGETSLMDAVNACINTAMENNYYTLWTAIAKIQSQTADEEAMAIVGNTPVFLDVPIDDTYAYLLDTTDLVKPELDLSNADGILKKILNNGVMVIATSPDYPANEFITEDGTVYGCEMMLAKYVADCLGVNLKIETMDFSAVLTAVDTGKVDMSFSGFGWKADRAEAFELSVGYVGDDEVSFHTLIVPADKADQYKSLQDFVGKHIIAQASSLQQMYVEDQILSLDGE
ncbi:MAG: transporter substrate-binding domain-containing protein [Erysipelotrichaceae bacterium]|nr:transporter substrate-binding domain-containing protein [Erysipelotrichaceae bacterium]